MENKHSRKLTIVGLITIGALYIGYYGYSKYDFARSVSADIDGLPALASERLSLKSIAESEKNFTLELTLSGVDDSAKNLAELKSQYDDIAVDYVCGTSTFDSQFKEGYQISFDIKYSEEPSKTFKQIYVSKERCSSH